jgi:hypothetical protein
MTTPRGSARTERERQNGAERQRRFRARARIREDLHDMLGHEPSTEIMAAAADAELRAMGIAPRPPVARAKGEEPLLPMRSAGQFSRAMALAGLDLELRIAGDRARIYDLLLASAEAGNVASLLWLASRLTPPARQRRVTYIPEIAALDLKTPEGAADAADAVLRRIAAGELELGDGQLLLDALRRRQQAGEATARAAAYQEAAVALKERRGDGAATLTARLRDIQARLAGQDEGMLLEAEPEPDFEPETVD